MGTVGLSFGSPTSGTGFNVSQTVSEIVANLQNVETPWKNQLNSLEGQDTAISSLGTLVSNLSNDVSSLTNFEGILAEKTGSSSNTNVLELTAASTAAVAGTHTVTVNSLAATSSGYLAEVSSSSAALSGQITLQTGSGSAVTFVIGAGSSTGATVYTGSGNNTLADLASAINDSGVGITANVEGDSAGSWLSLTSETSGGNGNISVSNNSIAAPGQVLSYTGTSGTDGSNPTASTGALTGVGTNDSLSGSLSIQVGSGAAVTVAMSAVSSAEGGTTVADLASFISGDAALSGITAGTTTNSDGTVSLTLTSNNAGSANSLTVNSSIVDSGATALAYTNAVTGVDANLTIDGKANIQSSSNTVSNLIPGVTFQLLSSSSEPVQVIIGNDNNDVESTVNQFVSDYNSLISAINTQEGNTSSGTPEPLFGSPTLSLLQEQLLNSVNAQNPNGYLDSITNAGDTLSGSISIQVGNQATQTVNVPSSDNTLSGVAAAVNAAKIGVTASITSSSTGSQLELFSETAGSTGALTVTSNVTDQTTGTALNYNSSGSDINSLTSLGIGVNNDGTLTFDSSSLDTLLNTDYSSVVNFFQNANSWGQAFSGVLNNAGTSSPTGILSLASGSNSNIESTLNAEISKENATISAEQSSLTAELNSANEIMQQLPTELNGMNELYSAITGYNQGSNG
ncbi:MAG TPA: flagellar filament capping protein FliD [Terracidiphilus sp.]|nr:flagellar filament capping protein FliD [Terracidiphilus sp.]